MFAAMLVPAWALAQPRTADDWYKEGETNYNLGAFEKAAEAFKQGFALEHNASKQPAYLYNVAQAYRLSGNCKDAAFFYKRYLSLKDQYKGKPLEPEKRADIEQKITELEQCVRQTDSIAKKPPDHTLPRNGKTGPRTPPPLVGQGEGEGEGDGDGGGVTTQFCVMPRTINARFVAGAGNVRLGDVPTGIKPTLSITGGHPVVTQGVLVLDVGASVNVTPMPYENGMTGEKHTAMLTTAFANAAATYTIAPRIALRGDLGVGGLFFSGLAMGNPFTDDGAGTSGTLGMLALRIAASADYALTPNLVATVTPFSVTYSPATDGLRSGSLVQLDFMLGMGYRM